MDLLRKYEFTSGTSRFGTRVNFDSDFWKARSVFNVVPQATNTDFCRFETWNNIMLHR